MSLTAEQLKSLVSPVEKVDLGDAGEVYARGLTTREVGIAQNSKDETSTWLLRFGVCDVNGARLFSDDDETTHIPAVYAEPILVAIARLTGMKMKGDVVDPSALAEKK